MARTDEMIWLKGKGMWVRPSLPDPWGNYKMVLYPTPESLAEINRLKTSTPEGIAGIRNVVKKDEDGYNITLRRPTQKVFKGKVVGFAPPDVLDLEDKPLRNVNIGNGSDVAALIKVYQYTSPSTGSKGRAIRWEAVKVLNLIPFDGKKDFTDKEQYKLKDAHTQQPFF